MAKGKVIQFAPRMDKTVPAIRRRKWRDAPIAEVREDVHRILAGEHQVKRHSDGETPWQYAISDYEIRFREKGRGEAGIWGIYLRDFDVCVATFAPNSAFLRNALARMFDAAHALAESAKIRGEHEK